MASRFLQKQELKEYRRYLQHKECSRGTIEKYLCDVCQFMRWLNGAAVERSSVSAWKQALLAQHLSPATINSKLAALNGLFQMLGWHDCRSSYIKVQRRLFRDERRALSRAEYERLLRTAYNNGQRQLGLVVETLGATGIRVSELSALTVDAVKAGRTDIHLKGKIRTILIPRKLCSKLLAYARAKKITVGEIFITNSGKPLSRFKIWSAMKKLASLSGVAPEKVFPHNLRHLFATEFYERSHDIARLADLLGHSSIETTRIYLTVPGSACLRQLESLRLIL